MVTKHPKHTKVETHIAFYYNFGKNMAVSLYVPTFIRNDFKNVVLRYTDVLHCNSIKY